MFVSIISGLVLSAGQVGPSNNSSEFSGTAADIAREFSLKQSSPLRIAPALASQRLWLRTDGASPAAVRRCLATALHAEVRQINGAYVISRSQTMQKQLEHDRIASRSEWLTKSLAAFTGNASYPTSAAQIKSKLLGLVHAMTLQRQAEQAGRIGRSPLPDPSQALCARKYFSDCLAMIGAHTLATLQDDHFYCFDSRETGSLTSRVVPALATHLPDYSQAHQVENEIRFSEAELAQLADSGSQDHFLSQLKSRANIVLVRIAVTVARTYVICHLYGYDGNGNLAMEDLAEFDRPGSEPLAFEIEKSCEETGHCEWVAPESESDLHFSRLEPAGQVPFWYQKPLQKDPLDAMVVPQLLTAYHVPARGCVAIVLNREDFDIATSCSKEGRLNLTAFKMCEAKLGLREKLSDSDFVCIRNRAEYADVAPPVSTRSLQAYSESILSREGLDFAAYCQACRASSGPDGNAVRVDPLWMTWPRMNDAWIASPQNHGNLSSQLAALLGSLDPETWQRLATGKHLSVDALAPGLWKTFIESGGRPSQVGDQTARHAFLDLLLADSPEFVPELWLTSSNLSLFTSNKTAAQKPYRWQPIEFLPTQINLPKSNFVGEKDGHAVMLITQQEFEKGNADWRGQFSRRLSVTVWISLPNRSFIKQEFVGPIKDVTEIVSYSGLPQEVRDEVWKRASASALAFMNQLLDPRANRSDASVPQVGPIQKPS